MISEVLYILCRKKISLFWLFLFMSILKGKASDGIEKGSKEKKSKSKDLKQVPNGKADSVGKNKKDKKEKVKKLPPAKQPSSSDVSVFPC